MYDTNFEKIKKSVQASDITEHRYSYLLDLLIEHDMRGADSDWDLWYFAKNTDDCFCFARYHLKELAAMAKKLDTWNSNGKNGKLRFNTNDARRSFCSFCSFLCTTLDSFAHEINILYQLEIQRHRVSFKSVPRHLKQRDRSWDLISHMEMMVQRPCFLLLDEYRNSLAHGFVQPLTIGKDDWYLNDLDNKRQNPIKMSNVRNIGMVNFSSDIYREIDEFLKKGWQCFTHDQLV